MLEALAASLTLVHRQPLVIRGAGFKAHERVVIREADARFVVHTTALGRFVVSLGNVDRCTGGRVVAVGAARDQAVLRLPPAACAPP